MPADQQPLARRIDAALPQTQCTRCGYRDCAGYAEAVAAGEAGIDQCPPGGSVGIARLSALTGLPAVALNPRFGVERPRQVAFVDEADCIGCTLCIEACPTAAILGAPKWLHTVLEARCTGCELCIPVCPVDCIKLEAASGERTGWAAWTPQQADAARRRYEQQVRRRADESDRSAVKEAAPRFTCTAQPASDEQVATLAKKNGVMQAALERARERRRSAT